MYSKPMVPTQEAVTLLWPCSGGVKLHQVESQGRALPVATGWCWMECGGCYGLGSVRGQERDQPESGGDFPSPFIPPPSLFPSIHSFEK